MAMKRGIITVLCAVGPAEIVYKVSQSATRTTQRTQIKFAFVSKLTHISFLLHVGDGNGYDVGPWHNQTAPVARRHRRN